MRKDKRYTTNNVGPGTYEAALKYMPLYKLKPSANFASSTNRTLEGFGIKPMKGKGAQQ